MQLLAKFKQIVYMAFRATLNFRQFKGKFSRTTTNHPGIFLGQALWADSVSPRTNTIASHVQCKPIRMGENLIVNYNS